MEDRFSQKIRDDLAAKGHKIKLLGDLLRATWAAARRSCAIFAKGINFGASDPRKDGAAIPELPAE